MGHSRCILSSSKEGLDEARGKTAQLEDARAHEAREIDFYPEETEQRLEESHTPYEIDFYPEETEKRLEEAHAHEGDFDTEETNKRTEKPEKPEKHKDKKEKKDKQG